ncbi:MAG TPA: hypothetical protein VGF20_08780, partial [Candidatus Acidoferrum sp.]
LLAAVHAISLFKEPAATNETEKQLVDLMINYKFQILGSPRSMYDFLRGFSIAFSLAALVTGTFDFVVRGERPGLLKKVALLNVLWLAVLSCVSLRYFFVVPTTFLVIAMLIFAVAWVKLPATENSQN